MLPNARMNEQLAVLASLDPVSQAASAVTSTYVSMAKFERLLAIIQTGVLGTAATVDVKLVQSTDASGTSVKDITGKAITQIVKATGDNKQVEINCRADQLDTNNGFGYVAVVVTVGAAASIVSGLILGGVAKELPASASNVATVVQIV